MMSEPIKEMWYFGKVNVVKEGNNHTFILEDINEQLVNLLSSGLYDGVIVFRRLPNEAPQPPTDELAPDGCNCELCQRENFNIKNIK